MCKFGETRSEEPHPLVLDLERVESGIDICSRHLCQNLHQFGLLEPGRHLLIIGHQAVVNLRCVFACLRNVVLQEGNLVVMAELSQFALEIRIIHVDLDRALLAFRLLLGWLAICFEQRHNFLFFIFFLLHLFQHADALSLPRGRQVRVTIRGEGLWLTDFFVEMSHLGI